MSRVEMKKKKSVEVKEDEIARNVDYSVKTMRWLLRITGMWPITSSFYPTILRVFLISAVWVSLVLFVVPCYLFMALVVKDIKIRLRCVGPLSFGLINVCKYASALIREGQLRECIEWMASDWRSVGSRVESALMLENTRSGRTFTIICITGVYMSCMSYATLFSFMMDPIVVDNRTTRIFAYPGYFVYFDPHSHFFKVYLFHVSCCFIQCTISCGVTSFAVACVMHVCGQIATTSWMLRSITCGSLDASTCRNIVEKHLRATALAKKLEGYLNSLCMIELLGSGLNICMLGYYSVTEHGQRFVVYYTYCVLLLSFTFSIFIYCYIGDQLTAKCDVIGHVAYNVEWYQFSAKDAKNLLMIVASAQRPIVLTAGKMTTLSMTCFSSVLKASFSYINMLRTVTNS